MSEVNNYNGQISYNTFGNDNGVLGVEKEETEISIRGMTCSMCTRSVEAIISDMDGVFSVNVSLAFNSAHIEYDPSKITRDDLVDAIEGIGYEVIQQPPSAKINTPLQSTRMIVEFIVSDMTCSMCTKAVTKALEMVPGVEDAVVSLSTNQARVEFDSSKSTIDDLAEAIEDVGYGVLEKLIVRCAGDDNESKPLSRGAGNNTVNSPDRIDRMLEQQEEEVANRKRAFLCYYGLRQGVMGMDVLVAVGTTASYGYALWATLTGGMEFHFFETSAVLICFVLLGKWMQTLAVRRTSQALTHLLKLQPKTAIKVIISTTNGDKKWNPLNNDPYNEEVVPITSIQTGDLVKILKGSSIPADGIIKFGEMTVDESMITGESIPVLKTPGAVVLGGTICAEAGQEAGASFLEVTGVGSNTALSQILKLVQDAQNRQ
ncbi:unnamed protein product [Pseudo-nitzschia multistriata]|uniref:P-type Cu(+) transporter n=1 Tax=Pseudo-nitzschia multistriata TaxID=183589 RepID=A0A448ZAQ1_9STRA|nr:unnamed protein product [Pseudo-nitzschia multistriata]